RWKETILHNFANDGIDGYNPGSGPIMDAQGNLYGTTVYGGPYGEGIAYELSPNGNGWTSEVLYSFGAPRDALDPFLSGLTQDSTGNLYGSTVAGGTNGQGTVYELSPAGDGTWTETILHSFTGNATAPPKRADGSAPYAGVTLDAKGNVYGTTHLG